VQALADAFCPWRAPPGRGLQPQLAGHHYVLGERIIRAFSRPEPAETQPANPKDIDAEMPWPEADDTHHA
jgi:hypothetical protein